MAPVRRGCSPFTLVLRGRAGLACAEQEQARRARPPAGSPPPEPGARAAPPSGGRHRRRIDILRIPLRWNGPRGWWAAGGPQHEAVLHAEGELVARAQQGLADNLSVQQDRAARRMQHHAVADGLDGGMHLRDAGSVDAGCRPCAPCPMVRADSGWSRPKWMPPTPRSGYAAGWTRDRAVHRAGARRALDIGRDRLEFAAVHVDAVAGPQQGDVATGRPLTCTPRRLSATVIQMPRRSLQTCSSRVHPRQPGRGRWEGGPAHGCRCRAPVGLVAIAESACRSFIGGNQHAAAVRGWSPARPAHNARRPASRPSMSIDIRHPHSLSKGQRRAKAVGGRGGKARRSSTWTMAGRATP